MHIAESTIEGHDALKAAAVSNIDNSVLTKCRITEYGSGSLHPFGANIPRYAEASLFKILAHLAHRNADVGCDPLFVQERIVHALIDERECYRQPFAA